ncbi:50S ribosomal protein L11 methyltransferase [soil metagenome]
MPERWLQVRLRSPSDELAGPLVEGLLASGGTAVEERGDELVTYLPLGGDVAADADSVVAAMRERLRLILGAEPPDLIVDDVPDEDWLALWRAGLGPRRIGERLVVAPTWSEPELEAGQLLISIDPQMAFGTGEHASTRGVLRLMQAAVAPGARLLDVGTGSAILAIAAARLGASRVVAVESDDEAMENAADNIERNGVTDEVTLIRDVIDDTFLGAYGGGAFDGILANVLSGVLGPLLPAFHRALASGGWAILSGILTEEAEAMRQAADAAGFAVEAEDAEEQWWSVMLRRIGS